MNKYATDTFLRNLYASAPKGRDLMDCPREDFAALAEKKRGQLANVLGLDRIRSLGASDKPEPRSAEAASGYLLQSFDFSLFPDLCVPFHVFEPEEETHDTVLYLIGHGPGAQGVLRPEPDGTAPLPVRFAQMGYRVIVPELIGFGESVAEDYLTES